jgi:hypothetical protein
VRRDCGKEKGVLESSSKSNVKGLSKPFKKAIAQLIAKLANYSGLVQKVFAMVKLCLTFSTLLQHVSKPSSSNVKELLLVYGVKPELAKPIRPECYYKLFPVKASAFVPTLRG